MTYQVRFSILGKYGLMRTENKLFECEYEELMDLIKEFITTQNVKNTWLVDFIEDENGHEIEYLEA